eukprot:2281540-Rhodomonas_salina.1
MPSSPSGLTSPRFQCESSTLSSSSSSSSSGFSGSCSGGFPAAFWVWSWCCGATSGSEGSGGFRRAPRPHPPAALLPVFESLGEGAVDMERSRERLCASSAPALAAPTSPEGHLNRLRKPYSAWPREGAGEGEQSKVGARGRRSKGARRSVSGCCEHAVGGARG